MRSFITTVILLTLPGSPVAFAQTLENARPSAKLESQTMSSPLKRDARLIGGAPIGHRQPHVSDVPSVNPNDLEHISEQDATVDRKLVICRGC
jgi:hypothetical protein